MWYELMLEQKAHEAYHPLHMQFDCALEKPINRYLGMGDYWPSELQNQLIGNKRFWGKIDEGLRKVKEKYFWPNPFPDLWQVFQTGM